MSSAAVGVRPPQSFPKGVYPVAPQHALLQQGQVIAGTSRKFRAVKYLGGFAHVYVVQSQYPVNGTRQHVLKRMVVPDESMLREVGKEVDVMKLLRGHPNIVNFIDASSQPVGNGAYEVFILMELCPGGGIIDMMNRRLRERLTETEILQIFVDVCEGVARMHNLQPPLLHRDLKVENILQASATTFKICDFGSACPTMTRAPSTTAEIRSLENDLNRHTTLQYRAPEMVDVYLRRPVDEKSDIWALGVLLYKLCYYTTPFEEHGPLAILNASYRTPPYPIYSSNMNNLIASMLREHGVQRPTVFDLLDIVHRMRGTQSQFRYARPSTFPALRPTAMSPDMTSIMQTKVRQPTSPSAIVVETRKDDPSSMRRGRPSQGLSLVPVQPISPIKSGPSRINPTQTSRPLVQMQVTRLDGKFPSPTGNKVPPPISPTGAPPSWSSPTSRAATRSPGKYIDSLVSSQNGFSKPSTPSLSSTTASAISKQSTSPQPPALPSRNRPSASARLNQQHRTGPTSLKRDAFEGLNTNYTSKLSASTLGSQMATPSSSLTAPNAIDAGSGAGIRSPSAPFSSATENTSSSTFNPSSYFQQQLRPLQTRTRTLSNAANSDRPIEERFPPIEDIDSHFSPPPSSTPAQARATSSNSLAPPTASPAPNMLRRTSTTAPIGGGLPRPRSPAGIRRSPSPAQRSTSPTAHPLGPRSQSPKIISSNASQSSMTFTDAASKLASVNIVGDSASPRIPVKQPSGLLPKANASETSAATAPGANAGSRFTVVNGGGVRLPGLAPKSPGASSSSEAPKRQSLQPSSRPSYLRAPSAPAAKMTLLSKPPRDWLTGDDDAKSPSAESVFSAVSPDLRQKYSKPESPHKQVVRPAFGASNSTRSQGEENGPSMPRSDDTGLTARSTGQQRLKGTGGTSLKAPTRGQSTFSTDSSGGDDGPEDATPRTLRGAIQLSASKSASRNRTTLTSPTRPSITASPVATPKQHVRKPSTYDLIDATGPGAASNGLSAPAHAAAVNKRSSLHDLATPRRQTSVQDLVDLSSPSRPIAMRAGSSNTSFTTLNLGSIATPSLTNSSPATDTSSIPLPVGLRKNLAGGPRARPQSLFLPASSTSFLPSSPSESLLHPPPSSEPFHVNKSENSSGTAPRAPRRLSISDMVNKYEALRTGDSPLTSGSPTTRIPSGGGIPALPPLGKAPTGSSAGSKPPFRTKPPVSTSQFRSSQPSPVDSSFGAGRLRAPSPSPVLSRSAGADTGTGTGIQSNWTGPRNESNSRSFNHPHPQRPSSRQQQQHDAQLNIVPPADFFTGDTSAADTPKISSYLPQGAGGRSAPPPASPSPERPYQGVGKLIDQWQKKTEANANDNAPPLRRLR